MIHCPDPKAISIRMNKLPLPKARPRVSHEPWLGFTRHDCPRGIPLPVCPSPRCRRAKACVASHDGLYCRRTHFSVAEQKKWERRDRYTRELEAVPESPANAGFVERAERLVSIYAIQLEHAIHMTERWKAGEFDHLYGPYRPKGVLMQPPPKVYVEGPENDGA